MINPGKGIDVLNRSKYEAVTDDWAERTLAKYVVDEDTGCWIWTGRVDPRSGGYPLATTYQGGRNVSICPWVLAYGRTYGYPEEGMEIDHGCHDPATCAGGPSCAHRRCINPAHLVAMTKRENSARSGSPAALAARRDCCTKGHPYTQGKGRRYCQVCANERLRRSRLPGGSEYAKRAERSAASTRRRRARRAAEEAS